MFTTFKTSTDLTNLNYLQADSLINKHQNQLYHTFDGKNVQLAMDVISMTPERMARFEKRSTTNKYELYRTILFMSMIAEADIEFDWDLEFCERVGKDGNPLSGKHKVKMSILQDIGSGVLSKNGKDSLGCLTIDIMNSYDGSMRFGALVGWLIKACLNGQIFSGKSLIVEDGKDTFLRQRHIHKTEEEVFEEMKKYAIAVVNYIQSEKVKELTNSLEDKNNTKISVSEQESLTKLILEKRVSYNLNKNFFTDGGSIRVESTHVEQIMDKMNNIARAAHSGDSVYEFEQRIQEAVGANNTPEGFARKVIDRIDYKKTFRDNLGAYKENDCHIRQINMFDQLKMNDFNLYISDLFDSQMNKVEEAQLSLPMAA